MSPQRQRRYKKITTRRRTAAKKSRSRTSRSTSRTATTTTQSKSLPDGPNQDKAELSPNSLAKCKRCGKKITKGARRIGRSRFNQIRQQYEWWYYHYGTCLPASVPLHLPGGASVEDALAMQRKQSIENERLLRERAPLLELFRSLRAEYARRLKVPPFMVLQNTVLEDICVALPQTKEQLCQVKGIGPKKWQALGAPILRIVEWYKKQCMGEVEVVEEHDYKASPATTTTRRAARTITPTRTSISRTRQSSSKKNVSTAKSNNPKEDNEDDDFVEIGPSLSVKELVHQKFQDAEANGYLIELD